MSEVFDSLADTCNDASAGERGLLLDVGCAVLQELQHIEGQVATHILSANFRKRHQGQCNDVIGLVVQIDPYAIGGHHEYFALFIEELSEPQVANPLLSVGVGSDQSQTLLLSKVSIVPQHGNKEQLGHVPGPVLSLIVAEGLPDLSLLLLNEGPLLSRSLAGPNVANQVP